jgi:hypothetical protein
MDLLVESNEIAITTRKHNIVYQYYNDDYVEIVEEIINIIKEILDPKIKK